MINGIMSRAYRVYRGVRQGDPLSCLLFDLAIEPLSNMIRKSDLRGFDIPRCEEVLKAVLFADDTTVYLSSQDDFSTLQQILDTWCSAAKARFNIKKTEIIPIGRKAYREEMAETYHNTGTWRNYPRGVHVARDGEAIRILGAFFGNGVNQTDIWSLVLTKIVAMRQPLMKVIERWKAGHATTQGKRHVVQMIVGGMTQFFTMVQRMPEEIRKRLDKIIRDYLWNDRHNTPVGKKHICLPIELGGLGILDLQARSDAIDIVWLKTYLDYSSERPIWAYVADNLFATNVPKQCRPSSESLQINPFLQNWSPKKRGLPPELKAMVNVAHKYGLRVEGLAFSRNIIRAMPMWDHLYAHRRNLGRLIMPSKLLTCLQQQHLAMSVGDFEDLAATLEMAEHQPKANCRCEGCVNLRLNEGCKNPHLCMSRARDMIRTLPRKWNPTETQPEDYKKETMAKLHAEGLSDELIPFNRCVTTSGDLGQVFRIFTEERPISNEGIEMMIHENGTALSIATDGSCLSNGEKLAQAGAGVFCADNHALNQSLRLPNNLDQSNQTGEMAATLLATTLAPSQTRVTQITDSQTTMDAATKWKQRHEDTGYIFQANANMIRAVVARLRMRKAHTLFRWIKGHSGHPENEAADRLAAEGAARPPNEQLNLEIPDPFAVTGAKLQAITQKLAYRAIRKREDARTDPRPAAVANLDRITCGIEAAFGPKLHDATVWKSLQSRHITRSTSQFIWMAIHDGYMIGAHWMRPKMSLELQQRAVCARCGERETMSHIIFECEARGQQIVWELMRKTWGHTGMAWHEPSWGTTFGAACAVLPAGNEGRNTAMEQLWCILATESLHLIWKLRCERVIQKEGRDFAEQEVTNRFFATMNTRLTLDRRTAAQARGKKALKPKEVEKIWSLILEDGENLPPKWVVNSGVLVGIKRGR